MELLAYTLAALAAFLLVRLVGDALDRRRKRQAAQRVMDIITGRFSTVKPGVYRRCSPAEAAQPFVAGCLSGCGWHQHEASHELAEEAARGHQKSTSHGVAWGGAERFKK